jgi:hypothetical protein
MPLSQTQRNLAVSVAVLVAFIVILFWIYRLPDPRSQEFPALVAMTAIVLCGFDVIVHTNTAIGRRLTAVLTGSQSLAEGETDHGIRHEVVAILWISIATLALVLAGFLVGILAYVFGYMVLRAGRSVRQGALVAVATTGSIWLGFELFLSYDLYPGVLFGN